MIPLPILNEQLRTANIGSPELDSLIVPYSGWTKELTWHQLVKDDLFLWHSWNFKQAYWASGDESPPFTTSLDAARSLIPKDWFACISTDGGVFLYRGRDMDGDWVGETEELISRDPALTLCQIIFEYKTRGVL